MRAETARRGNVCAGSGVVEAVRSRFAAIVQEFRLLGLGVNEGVTTRRYTEETKRTREVAMTTEIRAFTLSDAESGDEQNEVSAFLRSVEVERIDTAYVDGAWRILVLYQDMRRKEESKQIESAIFGALNTWRERVATRVGISRDTVLSDELLGDIARLAPTTEKELSSIIGNRNFDIGHHGGEIVGVVRHMLADLIG